MRTSRRAFITGISGFCGQHLAHHLVQEGYEVAGLDLTTGSSLPPAVVYRGDIRDPVQVDTALRAAHPTHVLHLAAITTPEASLDALYQVNVQGTRHLLEAARLLRPAPVVLIAGSSAAYGRVEVGDLPLPESQAFRPLNNYAVSKIAQEMLAYAYHARHDLGVIRTRTFNLVGPGQPPVQACAAFARQIAEIEMNRSDPVVRVGNLTPKRDFVDVRDAVRAYRLVAEQGQPGEVYNVCSGQAVSIQRCVDILVQLARVPIRIVTDPTRMRPVDIPISIGDGSRLRHEMGWSPESSLLESLTDLLQDWRQRTRKERE
jgi:GDP-4-dehydro-6-deoxy-D-mannose reductase